MRTRFDIRARQRIRGMAMLVTLCAVISGCQSLRLTAPVSPTEDVHGLGAPVDPNCAPAERIIGLDEALQIAGVANPTIAIADEIVFARLAERLQARSLWFPTVETGGNYRDHRGAFQSTNGTIVHTNEQSFFYGLGADVKGGGTVLDPGIRLVVHLGDAYYAPQAAQQRVTQSRFDAASTRHYTLLEVGVRYLALVEAQARLKAYQESLKEMNEIARLAVEQNKAGQGREADERRAQGEVLLLQGALERTREELEVAAAELARLLDLDPSIGLRPADQTPPLYQVVDPQATLPQLLETAWASHPEIVARSADVRFQEIRVRQEKMRPWLPVVALGFSVGEFGGGATTTRPTFGDFSTRTEVYVAAIWSLQNLGLGNHAVQNVARTGLSQAQLERTRLFDRIGREIAEAYSLIQARRAEIDLARKRVETSERSHRLELTRAKNLQARPIEVLTTLNQLTQARQDHIAALIGYSRAQLQLVVALGNPPQTAPRD